MRVSQASPTYETHSPDLMELYPGAGAQSATELDRTGHAAADRLRAVLQLDRT